MKNLDLFISKNGFFEMNNFDLLILKTGFFEMNNLDLFISKIGFFEMNNLHLFISKIGFFEMLCKNFERKFCVKFLCENVVCKVVWKYGVEIWCEKSFSHG